ncbi:MAG: hypothetical protein JOY70_03300 [Acidisphaera sp.]|nr:hypothetical protein [Acidisphaera sp.]
MNRILANPVETGVRGKVSEQDWLSAASAAPPQGVRKLVAVVHFDIVGYSRLVGADDAATLRQLRELRRSLVLPLFRRHGGTLVQTGGDSLLVTFDSILEAVRCASDVQRRMPRHNRDVEASRQIRFRVGIEMGDVIADGTDLHGEGVIVAVRLQTACRPGAVCISRAVHDHVQGRIEATFTPMGALQLKNVARPVEAFMLEIEPAPDDVLESDPLPDMSEATARALERLQARPGGAEPARVERRSATVMMMEVAGFDRVAGADPTDAYRRWREARARIEAAIARSGGSIAQRGSDCVTAEFPSAADATRCAAAIQERNEEAERSLPDERQLRLRIGVSFGEVVGAQEEIAGNAVTIAKRLQGVAAPGSILLSEAAAVASESSGVGLLDIGLTSIEGVARPIRVYRVASPGTAAASKHVESRTLVSGFGDRPAIAILPFRIQPPDPEKIHLAAGITEDVIAAVSRWRSFPVISRASVFALREQQLDVRSVGQKLGARYVGEGTLRERGSRLRATTELSDVETAETLVMEQFEYDVADLFAMQDEIVLAIIGAIEPELLRHERERAARTPPRIASAYDSLQRGLWHHYRYTQQDNAQARAFLRQAIDIAPDYAEALAGLSLAIGYAAQARWESDPKAAFQEVRDLGRRAVEADPRSPQARFALGIALYHSGRMEEGLRELREATRLNPSHAAAQANIAFVCNYLDHPKEALAAMGVAFRLSPHDPRRFMWLPGLAAAHYLSGNYTEALRAGHEALEANARYLPVARYIAASLGQLGQAAGARAILPLLRQLDGNLEGTRAHLQEYFVPTALERILDGLRRAGFG